MPEADRAVPQAALLEVLRRYWRSTLLAWLVVALAAAYLGADVEQDFVAEASLTVNSLPAESGTGEPVRLSREREQVESGVLAEQVGARLDPDADPSTVQSRLTVDADSDTDVMVFAYRGSTREEAVLGAQAFAEVYLEERRERAETILADLRERTAGELALLEAERDALGVRLQVAVGDESVTLRSRLNVVLNDIGVVQRRRLGLEATTVDVGAVFSPATTRDEPVGLSPETILLVGLLAGAVLGVSQAALRDRLDRRFRDPADIESLLGAPELVSVPRATRPWAARRPSLVGDRRSRHAVKAAEAYRVLAVSLQTQLARLEARSVAIVAIERGDGATTTTANLAHVLASSGLTVAVVSADLSDPTVHLALGADEGAGLADVLVGRRSLDDVDLGTPVEGVHLLRAGSTEHRRPGALALAGLEDLVADLERDADLVLVDAGPVSTSSEAVEVGRAVGQVLVVLRASGIEADDAFAVRRRLTNVDAPIIGFVRNRPSFDALR